MTHKVLAKNYITENCLYNPTQPESGRCPKSMSSYLKIPSKLRYRMYKNSSYRIILFQTLLEFSINRNYRNFYGSPKADCSLFFDDVTHDANSSGSPWSPRRGPRFESGRILRSIRFRLRLDKKD